MEQSAGRNQSKLEHIEEADKKTGVAHPGGGALLYNRGYGCASGTFKPLPFFADQNFGKILDPLQPNGRRFSKIYALKRGEMNF